MKKLNSTCLGQRKKKQGAMFSRIVVGEGFSDPIDIWKQKQAHQGPLKGKKKSSGGCECLLEEIKNTGTQHNAHQRILHNLIQF